MVRFVAVLLLSLSTLVSAEAKPPKPKKPSIELRVMPRAGMAPREVYFLLVLEGGDEHEDYYCPRIEWDFGDAMGHIGSAQGDCPPWEPGKTTIQRRYSARLVYYQGGHYTPRVTLYRGDKVLARTSATLTLLPLPPEE